MITFYIHLHDFYIQKYTCIYRLFFKPVKDFKQHLQNSEKFRPFRSIQTYLNYLKPTQIQSKSF